VFRVINFSVESNLRNLVSNKTITIRKINHYILIKILDPFSLLILLHYSLPSFLVLFLEVLQTSIYLTKSAGMKVAHSTCIRISTRISLN
jgi:hypothetical protein